MKRRFYSIQQIEFCRNFIFKRNFPIVPLENLEICEPMRIILSWIILLCCPFLSRHFLQLCPRYSARVLPCCWKTWLSATKSACFSGPRENARN
jgi:hypothetical protein